MTCGKAGLPPSGAAWKSQLDPSLTVRFQPRPAEANSEDGGYEEGSMTVRQWR